jgi:hypothetical protein
MNRDGVATSPDGTNWAARADSRILGSWVAGGLIGFMFHAKQDSSFPYPYTIVTRFNQSTRAFVDRSVIFNNSYAWLYPSVSVNAAGNLAGIIYFGGGTIYPDAAAWISDDVQPAFQPLNSYGLAGSNAGPLSNAWGDYFTARQHQIDTNTWVAGAYYLNNGGNDFNVVQRFSWFGRARDFTTVQVNVQTNPAGLSFTVDGTTFTSPQVFNWTVSTAHTISTSSPQTGMGTQYVWSSWSDNGAISHTVSPTSNTTYTASFTTQYLLSTAVSPSGSGSVTANPTSTSGYYNNGASVQLTATANAGFQFANWTGDLTGTTNPQSVTMSAPRSVTANFNAGITIATSPSEIGRASCRERV